MKKQTLGWFMLALFILSILAAYVVVFGWAAIAALMIAAIVSLFLTAYIFWMVSLIIS